MSLQNRIFRTLFKDQIIHQPTGGFEGSTAIVTGQNRLSAGDQLDTQRIPPGNTKGYQISGIRAGWHPSRAMDASAALENITTLGSRVHGSGVHESDTNLIVFARPGCLVRESYCGPPVPPPRLQSTGTFKPQKRTFASPNETPDEKRIEGVGEHLTTREDHNDLSRFAKFHSRGVHAHPFSTRAPQVQSRW